MKTLSGRQPWWWAILTTAIESPKRIENRKWNTHYRGPIFLHAAKGCAKGEFLGAMGWMVDHGLARYEDWPGLDNVQRGGIVGRARIVDVITPCDDIPPSFRSYPAGLDSRWHMQDQYGFVLADVEPLPFVPYKGALGLFDIPESALTVVR